jgi:hypothetical protein
MRLLLLTLCSLLTTACMTSEEGLRLRHGSPLYTRVCKDGKTLLSRQMNSGEVEVAAGGRTQDAANGDGDGEPVPGRPRLEQVGDAMRLTGMPGGPYEACLIARESAG